MKSLFLCVVTLDYQYYSPLRNPDKVENMLDRAKALSCLNLKGAFQPLLWTEQEATQIGGLFQTNSTETQQLK